MLDECHLLWGDLLGYAWGRTDVRIEVPLKNEKERQTYYGALDYQTKEFIVKEYKVETAKILSILSSIYKGNDPEKNYRYFGMVQLTMILSSFENT